MRSGALTPREWLDWVLDEYGLTVEEMASGAATGRGVAAPALTLICNVLAERFGPPLAAEVINHRRDDGQEFTREQIYFRTREDVREKHGVSDDSIAYHLSLLVDPPHLRGQEKKEPERDTTGLPFGWEEKEVMSNGAGNVMATATYRDGHTLTVWAWDEQSARAALTGAVRNAEDVRRPERKNA